MKKVFILSILVLFVGSLLALESDPSDVVGFFAIDLDAGAYESITLPMEVYDADSDGFIDIGEAFIGFGDNDTAYEMQTNFSAAAFGGVWYGTLSVLNLGNTYWMKRDAGNPNFTFYLTGTVNPASVNYNIVNGYTAFGLNEARNVALADLGFEPGEIQDNDTIYDMNNNESAAYFAGTWYGTLANSGGIKPTHTYWLYTTNATGFTWEYVPGPARGTISNKSNLRKSVKSISRIK